MFVYNVNKGGVIAVKGLLLHSLSTKQPLEIIYLSDKGEISQRAIVVEEIQKDKIVAFCKLRNQYRIFKIENILSIGIAKKKGRKAWAS
jgi:predicted DNA-binding transcriptional regulator YafY